MKDTAPAIDPGARNLAVAFFAVVAVLMSFYAFLARQSLVWSPAFFIDAPSDREGSGPGRLAVGGPPEGAAGRGRLVYRRAGCAVCHGLGGRGGVENPNYVNGTSPALDLVAERLFLVEPEDVEAFLGALDAGGPLDAEALDLPRARLVLAQYGSVRDVIARGNPGGKKDALGSDPFDMPPWEGRLSPREIDDVIAYLVSRYPWPRTEE